MGIKSIKVVNLLSFENEYISEFSLINCFVGRNNVGKSNLFKLVRYFYDCLEGTKVLSPDLNSNYSAYGYIELSFDTSHINKLVHSARNQKNRYFNEIYKTLFLESNSSIPWFSLFKRHLKEEKNNTFRIRLNINSNGSFRWANSNSKVHRVLLDIFPLFEIDVRKLELHNWDEIWEYLGKLRPFNVNKFQTEIKSFIDTNDKKEVEQYRDAVLKINELSQTDSYNYREKVVNYLKMGLKGHQFINEGMALNQTSDGTNSYNYLLTVFNLVSHLSRNLYLSPIVLVDEPEVGLHPKKTERLVSDLYKVIKESYIDNTNNYVRTSIPSFIFATHSQNFLKQVILKFQNHHVVQHVVLDRSKNTRVAKLNSNYDNTKFLSIFSDNEARLFFSSFILFVEGDSEYQMFSTPLLAEKFPFLLDVDVYAKASHNVLSEGVNPSQINTAIPYLFLFDADKAFDFDYGKKCTLKLKKTSEILNLKPLGIKSKLSFYGRGFSREYRSKKAAVLRVRGFHDNIFKHSKTRLIPKNPQEIKNLIKDVNYICANDFVFVLPTTYEGLLINENSSQLFFLWLKKKGFDTIEEVLKIVNSRKMLSEEMLIQYLRIVFNGKSDSLLKKANFKKPTKINMETMCSSRAKTLLAMLEAVLKIPKEITDKTSGWASEFLTYAILEIETESNLNETSFTGLFKVYFPELFDILCKLQFGSRGGN
jgi:AAA15 family ATPase/GTPase